MSVSLHKARAHTAIKSSWTHLHFQDLVVGLSKAVEPSSNEQVVITDSHKSA
jgi:hypothetical protein